MCSRVLTNTEFLHTQGGVEWTKPWTNLLIDGMTSVVLLHLCHRPYVCTQPEENIELSLICFHQHYQSAHSTRISTAQLSLMRSLSTSPTWKVKPVLILVLPSPFHTVTPLFLYLCSVPGGNQVLGSALQGAFRPCLYIFIYFFKLCLSSLAGETEQKG